MCDVGELSDDEEQALEQLAASGTEISTVLAERDAESMVSPAMLNLAFLNTLEFWSI